MAQSPESFEQQVRVFDKCLEIYSDRSKTRGELWADFDFDDALHNCKSKYARAYASATAMKINISDVDRELFFDEALDSLYDLINYAAFAVRHLTGEKPDARQV